LRMRIKEVAGPRVYLDPKRAFGGVLNDAGERLAYYRQVIANAERDPLPEAAQSPCSRPRPPFFSLRCCEETCW